MKRKAVKRIAITGGGTGGHLVIAKALKEEAIAQGIKVVYFGSTYGQDQAWFSDDKDWSARYFLETSGVVNKRGIKKLFALFAILKGVVKVRKLLTMERIDAVISVGGYSAAPASFAAISRRIPFFIHEQNAAMGRLNRLLKPFAKKFFSSYTSPKYDYPVQEIFFQKARDRHEVKTIIFLGGSQGAKAINDLAIRLAPKLKKMGIYIIHQAGKNDMDRVKKAYETLDVQAELFDFSKEIPTLMTHADFAIARAGASTVWETTANGLPTLFIPYPYAADDHQAANAKAHLDEGVAWMMREEMINDDKIIEIIQGSMKDASVKLQKMLSIRGAQIIIDEVKKEI